MEPEPAVSEVRSTAPSRGRPALLGSLRLAGYALAALMVIRLGSGLSLSAFTVPVQRLALAVSLTEAAPFLLLALGLIFAGGNGARRRGEARLLVILQRLLLPLLIGYGLLAPLVVTDAFRAYRGADDLGSARLQEARQFRTQVVEAVTPVATINELAEVLRRFPQIRSAINPSQSLDAIKATLFDSLAQAVVNLENRQGNQLSGARGGLVQRTILTTLLALTATVFLQLLRLQNLGPIRQLKSSLHAYFSADLIEPFRPEAPRRPAFAPGEAPSPGWFAGLFRPDPTRPRRPPKPPRPPRTSASGPPNVWQKLWGGAPPKRRLSTPPPARKPLKPPKPQKRPWG